MLEKYFEYKKHKTNFRTEVIAGVTTFLTMAYIMFLNPFILSGEFAGPERVSLNSALFYCNNSCDRNSLFHNGFLRKNLADWTSSRNGY